MKKIILSLICFVVAALSASASEGLAIKVADIVVTPGQTVSVPLSLVNGGDITALSMKINVTGDLKIDWVNAGANTPDTGKKKWNVDWNEEKNLLAVYNSYKNVIGDGEFASVDIIVPADFTGGTIDLTNVSASNADAQSQEIAATATINVYNSKYIRSTATNNFGTICLPAAFTVEGANIYSAAVNNDKVVLSEVTTPVAGTPYIYQATADAQTFTMSGDAVSSPVDAAPLVGVFAKAEVPVGSYVLQTKEGAQKFYLVNGSLSIANRAYLTTSSKAKEFNIVFEGDVTAVTAVKALLNGNGKIYDACGRQLKRLQKGVNIVNGVSVIVK